MMYESYKSIITTDPTRHHTELKLASLCKNVGSLNYRKAGKKNSTWLCDGDPLGCAEYINNVIVAGFKLADNFKLSHQVPKYGFCHSPVHLH